MKYRFSSVEHKIFYQRLISHQKTIDTNLHPANDTNSISHETNFLARNNNDAVYGLTVQFNENIGKINQQISLLTNKAENPAYRPLFGTRKIFGRMHVFLKKIQRRLLKWYIEPFTLQQTQYNHTLIPTIGIQNESNAFVMQQINMLNQDLIQVKSVLNDLKSDNIKLQNENRELTTKLDTLSNSLSHFDKELKSSNQSYELLVDITSDLKQNIYVNSDQLLNLTNDLKELSLKYQTLFQSSSSLMASFNGLKGEIFKNMYDLSTIISSHTKEISSISAENINTTHIVEQLRRELAINKKNTDDFINEKLNTFAGILSKNQNHNNEIIEYIRDDIERMSKIYTMHILSVEEKLKQLQTYVSDTKENINNEYKLILFDYKQELEKILSKYNEQNTTISTQYASNLDDLIRKVNIEFENLKRDTIEHNDKIKNELSVISNSVNDSLLRHNNTKDYMDSRFKYISIKYKTLLSKLNQHLSANLVLKTEFENFKNEVYSHDKRLEIEKIATSSPYAGLYYSYSQAGEDVIIEYLFRLLGISLKDVTYLDLGANHPIELSNTYAFYEKNARGVLVEPNKNVVEIITKHRPEDLIINKVIHTQDNLVIPFYISNYDGLSSIDEVWLEDCKKVDQSVSIKEVVQIQTITVNTIIKEHFKAVAPSLISIDIEGQELSILNSIDFMKYRPSILVVETIEFGMKVQSERAKEIDRVMQKNGYMIYAFTGINTIYVDTEVLLNRK